MSILRHLARSRRNLLPPPRPSRTFLGHLLPQEEVSANPGPADPTLGDGAPAPGGFAVTLPFHIGQTRQRWRPSSTALPLLEGDPLSRSWTHSTMGDGTAAPGITAAWRFHIGGRVFPPRPFSTVPLPPNPNPNAGKQEPSPEDCDQAVEGLTSAKAKIKQQQEVQKKGDRFVNRLWRQLLGIGPALRAVASMTGADWAKKLTQWRSAFSEALQHYWVGTKLLWADVRISSRLLLKLASGKTLTRRERQQLTRTTADIFRLGPFAVFILVPFMEFLLPVFIKVFPNMLPSTFQDKMKEQEALKKRLNARIQYAKFLQDTVKEMAKEIKTTRSGDVKRTADDLDEFMNKVRKGDQVSNDEILGFAKLFNDELTLDNISRPRLVSMCKYMGIQPYGTDAYLRYMLRSKLAKIKSDDRMIQSEGIESLSELELRAACRDRGMLGILSVEEMSHQLKDWLDLSLNHSVPSSLLILSRSFLVSGKLKPEEAVQATLSSLPDEVVGTVGITTLPSEDTLAERKRKLEFLQMQEELIKEESGKEELQEKKKKDLGVEMQDSVLTEDVGTANATEDLAKKKPLERQEHLCKLSAALALLASTSEVAGDVQMADAHADEVERGITIKLMGISLYYKIFDEALKNFKGEKDDNDYLINLIDSPRHVDFSSGVTPALRITDGTSRLESVGKERAEFLRMVNEEIKLYNNVVDKVGKEGFEETRKAYQVAHDERVRATGTNKVSAALIDKVDALLHKLEKELDDVDAKIGDEWRILDTDFDGKVTPEEVAAAVVLLKDSLSQDSLQELISKLSKDKDGKILVEDIVRLGSVVDTNVIDTIEEIQTQQKPQQQHHP